MRSLAYSKACSSHSSHVATGCSHNNKLKRSCKKNTVTATDKKKEREKTGDHIHMQTRLSHTLLNFPLVHVKLVNLEADTKKTVYAFNVCAQLRTKEPVKCTVVNMRFIKAIRCKKKKKEEL